MLSSRFYRTSIINRAFSKYFSGHTPSCGSGSLTIIRKPAPEFKGTAWWNNEFKQISLDTFQGKWVCLFFYPLDFTFVCPTEIVDFDLKSEEFSKLNCQVIGCSVDSHFSHREFALKPREQGGLAPLKIPLLADITKGISKHYGVLVDGDNDGLKGVSLRGTFLIDEKRILRHATINDANVGRNVDETLRILKAFQYADKHGEVCPSGWTPGKKAMDPNVNSTKLTEFWQKEHATKH
jgi:alkyl hydroperoxide reductase subunit AhpC